MADVPKIAVNGFGRIGRLVTRALVEMDRKADLVAINDLAEPEMLAHLFAYDSVHGHYPGPVDVDGQDLVFNGDRFRVLAEKDPTKLPWKDLDVDVVLESTGKFRTREGMQKHVDAGAKRVVLSAPAKGEAGADVTVVRGVNNQTYDPESHRLVSNASCTTNCLAPVLKVLHEAFGVEQALMTTVHAYTNNQKLLDSGQKDFRRARAAALSMVPTSTGAASAIAQVIPELAGKVNGMAIRVPVPNVSLVDLSARLSRPTDVDEVTEAYRGAEKGPLRGILRCEDRELVSVDYNHNPYSATVDVPGLMVVDDSLVKVLAWYDNEWGYAMRTAELIHEIWGRENGGPTADEVTMDSKMTTTP